LEDGEPLVYCDTLRPSHAFQARAFVEGLNRGVYVDLLNELHNDRVMAGADGPKQPKSLEEAMAIAAEYSVVKHTAGDNPTMMSAVFATEARLKGNVRGGGEKKGGRDKKSRSS
jgi:hypothetical protein